MKVWDLRYSLTRGPRKVEGKLADPDLGEASAFLVAPTGTRKARRLKPEDWAIDSVAVSRKVAERARGLHAAAASNPAMTAHISRPNPSDPARDFPSDFHLENGNYTCHCVFCGHTFRGYKRRVVCRVCEESQPSNTAANRRSPEP